MQGNLLTISLLGTFSVSAGKQIISDSAPRAHNLWKLFKYLLAYRGKYVSVETLIDALWPEEAQGDSLKAIQNLVYRLRKLLPADQNFILFSHNSYCWNVETPYYLDVEEFEKIAKQIKDFHSTMEEQHLTSLCEKEMELYTGDFLEDLADCEWAYPMTIYYRNLHSDCLRIYLDLLIQRQDSDEIIDVCTKALAQNNSDEHFHACLINALVAKGDRYGAAAHYQSITDLLKNEFHAEPSEELKAAGQNLKNRRDDLNGFDLDSFVKHFCQEVSLHGPYFCNLSVFHHICGIFLQAMERNKQPFYLLMLSIDLPFSEKKDDLIDIMQKLKRSCYTTLRSSDILTQHSPKELLLLLPSAKKEDIPFILKRIESYFFAQVPKNSVILNTESKFVSPETHHTK